LFYFVVGCIGAAVNGGIQPCFAILFSEILGVFSLVDQEKQRNQIALFSGLFVAMGGAAFFGNIIQVSNNFLVLL